jgi:cell division septal protein FtsQ
MATVVGDLGRETKRPLFFRRPGERDLPLQKNRRRRVLRPGHILILLALQAAFFLAVSETYLFLITWDELDIRRVEVVCAKDNLRRTLEDHFVVPRLGNILLCDLQALRVDIRRLAWVKDASIQKVFPSTLRISIVERTPFALLERDGLRLADEQGRALERVYSPEEYGLPVVSDANGFTAGFAEKWAAARVCLESLPPAERACLAGIRCGDYGALELFFKDDPVRVVVDRGAPAGDLALFRSRRPEWEGLYGPLEAVDMSYEGRVYLQAAKPAEAADPNLTKETE